MQPRRALLARAASAGAAITLPFDALHAVSSRRGLTPDAGGYGPLSAVADETTGLPLLQLPAGFRYLSFGWTGDRLDNGRRTPPAHDGMAAFSAADGVVHLVRNHELEASVAFDPERAWDPGAGGGTTTVAFDPMAGLCVGAWAGLAGTLRNCAGGATPWGSWLSCEESVLGPADHASLTQRHGYVFEVPPAGARAPQPLVAMGRFVHEAVAIDPATGIVYKTEDADAAGLYRFVPVTLAGCRRAAACRCWRCAAVHAPTCAPASSRRCRWASTRSTSRSPTSVGQGVAVSGRCSGRAAGAGGATFARLEGACHADGRIYVTSTSGGDARSGQV